MNSWNVPGQSDARGAIRNLAKTNIIFVLATRFRGGARVPARLVFRHVFIATFDAPIPTCGLAIVRLTDIMTTFGLASKKITAGFDDHRPLKYQILKSFSGLLLKT